MASLSCNDYIIQGEEFPRDFEGMYQNHEDPWDQLKERNSLSRRLARTLLEHNLNQGKGHDLRILDIGAGLGGFTEYLAGLGTVTATDISATAVEKARERTQGIEFVQDDIRCFRPEWSGAFDVICALELLYYVAPELDRVLKNLQRYLKGNGSLLFTYYFPEKAWTKRYIPSQKALLDRLRRFFVCDEFIDVNPQKESRRVLVGLLSKAVVAS